MDDFKTICKYNNSACFSEKQEDFSDLLKIQHFQISFHMPYTYLILLN